MASFETFRDKLWAHFEEMIKDGAPLFRTGVSYEDLWDAYLNSFTDEENPIFRVRRTYDCSCCRHFIRDFGDVVTSKDGVLTSIWDFDAPAPFDKVCKNLSKLAKSDYINEPFWSRVKRIGTEHSIENLDMPIDINGYGRIQTMTYKHFYCDIPDSYYRKWSGRSRGDYVNEVETAAIVLKRAAEEIPLEAIDVVLDLIANGNLYKGDEWQTPLKLYHKALEQCKEYQNDYARFVNYCWEVSAGLGPALSRIRNHSIGVLLVDISEGMDLETAVKKYEKIVAPENYKRPKAIYTKAMLQRAKEEIETLGFKDSLKRRFATKDDIPLSEVIFYNNLKKTAAEDDIFGEMEKECTVNPKKFENSEEVSADDFYAQIANGEIQSIDILLENRLTKNFCSLTAPEVADSKSMFKWGSPIGWAYTGNIADSQIKENVKVAGGVVDCDVRFSIQWNDNDIYDGNDLDAHCLERYYYGDVRPRFSDTTAYEIYFQNKRHLSPSKGMLDVDIIHPNEGKAAVENIFYKNVKDMKDGVYTFAVHPYSVRRNDHKMEFKAQLDILGDVREFEYSGRATAQRDFVVVAEIEVAAGQVTSIKEKLSSQSSSKEKWGVNTCQFHPVTMIVSSPNCWGGKENVVGNRHKFFIVDGMKNDENPNAFFNEFLTEELGAHKRFMEALGGKLQLADAESQLSGVGFSSTIRNYAFFRINGKKVIKVAF